MDSDGLRKRRNLNNAPIGNAQENEKISDEDSGIEEDNTFREKCKEFPYDTYWLARICFLRALGGVYCKQFFNYTHLLMTY